MIKRIIKGIFNLVIGLVSLILSPIDNMINSAIPSIGSALSYINNFLDFIGQTMKWVLSWFHLPSAFVTLLVGYWTFKLTLPLAIHTIKLAIKWYDKLKI